MEKCHHLQAEAWGQHEGGRDGHTTSYSNWPEGATHTFFWVGSQPDQLLGMQGAAHHAPNP